MSEPCIHEMDPAYCSACNGAEKRAKAAHRREPARFGPWFPARYDGRCSGCGEPFEPGEKIRSDGDGGWLCEDCGDAEP